MAILVNNHNKSAGFSLVELVAVIVIVGVLSVYVVPKFIGSSSVSISTAQNIVISAARRAQQMAMNRGASANVQFQTDDTNDLIRVVHSGPDSPLIFSLDGQIQITPAAASLTYDVLGNPNSGLTINLDNGEVRCVQIETTGYAHAC